MVLEMIPLAFHQRWLPRHVSFKRRLGGSAKVISVAPIMSNRPGTIGQPLGQTARFSRCAARASRTLSTDPAPLSGDRPMKLSRVAFLALALPASLDRKSGV